MTFQLKQKKLIAIVTKAKIIIKVKTIMTMLKFKKRKKLKLITFIIINNSSNNNSNNIIILMEI